MVTPKILVIMGVLVASVVITQLSISSNYLGVAYSETGNNIASQPMNQIPGTTMSNLNNKMLLALIFGESNSTQPITPVFSESNSTQYVKPIFGESDSTRPIESWRFDRPVNNAKSVGDVHISSKPQLQNIPSKFLQLQGNGYMTRDDSATTNLSALTISALVKPDYSHGSGTFTVISKERQFILAVNNNIPPVKIATFSVFDGVKWSTVNSTSVLGENWTHLGAMYNGSSISIYVNGTLQSSLHIAGILTLSVNGHITTTDVNHISSNEDVVIGAYSNSLSRSVNDLFSGSIQDVDLYNSTFTQTQMKKLYLEDISSIVPGS